MISSIVEYQIAQEELRDMETRLTKLQENYPLGEKGYTEAGIRKMIARVQEELAVYEAHQ